jgi:hypothetical protein
MTIHNLSLITGNVDQLSTQEVCEMCFGLNQNVFTYIRNVLLETNHAEHKQMARCYHLIRGYIEMLHIATGNGKIKGLKVELHSLTCKIVNLQPPSSSFVDVKMNDCSFKLAGPVALIKLLVTVINSALSSLSRKAIYLQGCEHVPVSNLDDMIITIQRDFTIAVKLLYDIVNRIPNTTAYLINNETSFTDVRIQLDDCYNSCP